MRGVSVVAVLFLLCSLALMFAAAESGWAAPTIARYQIRHQTVLWDDFSGEYPWWNRAIGIHVGHVEDVETVIVEDSAGVEHLGSPIPVWYDEDGNACLCVSWDESAVPVGGPYRLTVRAKEGTGPDPETVVTPALTHFPWPPPHITYPVGGSVINDLTPTVTWDEYPGFDGAGAGSVESQGVGLADDRNCFSKQCGIDPAATAASLPALERGHTYSARLWEMGPWIALEGTSPPGIYREETGRGSVFAVYSPIPVIDRVQICRGHTVDAAGAESYEEHVLTSVTDWDGWQDVWVCTRGPDGAIHPAAGDCDGSWNEGPYTLNQGWGRWTDAPLLAGPFTVVACDSDGDYTAFVTDSIPAPPPSVPSVTYPSNGEVLPETETLPTFQWDPVPGADHFEVWVEDAATGARLWQGGTDSGASSLTYAGDPLSPGHVYRLQVRAWYPDQDPSDPVSARLFAGRMVEFAVYSPTPVIRKVDITRFRDVDATGAESFGECAQISVTDWDGLTDPNGQPHLSVLTRDPNGRTHPGSEGGCDRSSNDGHYTLTQNWSQGEAAPPNPGSYRVEAEDSLGRTAEIVTEPAPEVPLAPDITYPQNGSTVLETAPRFSWGAMKGVDHYCLCVEEAGHNAPPPWVWGWWGSGEGCLPGTATDVAYNENGSARDPQLTPGHLYRLHVLAFYPDADPDSRVALYARTQRTIEFWVAPKPAPVPIQGTLLSLGDAPYPSLRTGMSNNVTPAPPNVGGDCDLTRDGSKFVYAAGDGIHVCNADGSDDTTVLAQAAPLCNLHWSPDGQQIAFNSPTEDDPTLEGCGPGGEVFVINSDGSDPRRITHHQGPDQMKGWSPDGRFILWEDAVAWQVWVGRPDGTAGHALTGPGLTLDNGDWPVWSPDGSRVALEWGATTPEGDVLATLGTIAPDGTDPRPILQYTFPAASSDAWWLNPYPAAWSPDGRQIALWSALQVLPDRGTDSDVEMYIVNADGSGLQRLTYDFSSVNPRAWIGPNTQRGSSVSVPICNVTTRFPRVTAAGLTTSVVATAPAPPAGFIWIGDAYHIATTATVQGAVAVAIHYDRSLVPGGKDGRLALLHRVNGKWVDVTSQIDPEKSIISGACPLPKASGGTTDLGIFAIAFKTK